MGADHSGVHPSGERGCSGDTDLIAIAYILGAQGVRGHVRIQRLTDSPERFVRGLAVVVVPPGNDGGLSRTIEDVSVVRERLSIKVSGVDTRNDAERLRGGYIKVPRAEAAALPEGRYYVFDIVGLEVLTTGGRSLGVVADVLETGANDVYVVKPVGGGKDILIPAVKQVVKRIDLDSRKMVIEPLEGLI